MTRDDIIRMACEAGAYSPNNPDDYAFSVKELGRFAALVISQHVKETRPEVADSMATWLQQIAYQHGGIGDLSRTEMEFGAMVAAAEREACAELVWPTQQVKVWSDEELTDMTGAFNRAQEKHGWYETIMAVGAAALKCRAAAIRARGEK